MARPTWIGKKLGGRYLIQELLGQGGMSAVYKAMDENLNRVVAVKLIHPHLSTDPEFVRRFEEEARAVAQLRHPNIIQVYDFDHDDDVYYIVFEFVPGETLQDRLKRLHENDRRMEIDKTISIGAKLADALDYAHSRNLIHRDVKPANVMLNVNNEPVLMDFGIVKIMGGTQHTATGAVMGTARYMSPEQIKGERIDERTDIYSLGVVIFEMAGGRAPFEADSAMTIMMMHVNDPVPDLRRLRPNVSPGLIQVINKTLNKDREKRFGRASEIARALRHPGLSATKPAPAADATVIEPLPTRDVSQPEATPTPKIDTPARGSTGPVATPAAEREPATGSAPPASVASPSGAPGSGLLSRPALIGGAIGLVILAVVCVVGASLLLNSGLLGGGGDNGTPVAVGEETPDTEEIAGNDGAEETAEAEEAALEQTAEAQDAAMTATAEYEAEQDAQATTDAEYAEMTATAAWAATATQEALPPTETPTPTTTPTPTVPPGIPFSRINNIELENGVYIVEYETFEYTETLPGMHVHFFFDTVPPELAGVGSPNAGPWQVYGGPRPFTLYGEGDRPAAAEEMCILVANPDHSVQANSGNCYPLPEAGGG